MPPKPNQLDIIDKRLDEEDASSCLEAFNESISERAEQDQSFRETDITRYNKKAMDDLIANMNADVIGSRNVATISMSRMGAIHSKDPMTRLRELHRGMDDILNVNPSGGDPIVARLVADDANAAAQFRGQALNGGWNTQLLIPIIGTLALVAFGAVVAAFDQPTSSRSEQRARTTLAADSPLDQTTVGHRLINLTSLALEAAANLPINFQSLGVSNACYAQFRTAIVNQQEKLPEELWWRLLADQAVQPFPTTDNVQTPANHFMAMSFCLDILKSLYSPQPLDLDMDETVEALANSLNLNDPLCMAAYYSTVPELISEDSGANRAQRVFLARAGLARAFSRFTQAEA